MGKRRQSGSVRRFPSGRWQARITDLDGRRIPLGTFATKADADRALSIAMADRARGAWVDPKAGRVKLATYAGSWLESRPRPLRPRTRELYEQLLSSHINPALGAIDLSNVSTARVRKWLSDMRAAGKGEPVIARCYRLLRAILSTAVEDELIAKNPCTIKGAGTDHTAERPVARIEEVYEIADAVDERFRALVLTAAFTSLREGELFALTRRRVDLAGRTITVVDQLHTLGDGRVISGPPKTDAGTRVVSIPESLAADLATHLSRFTGPSPDALVFSGARGAPLRRSYWGRKWRAAVSTVGMSGFRFHDLRHTGNTLAAATGASTKELMARMGHASPRAALIYQHATRERDRAIATALDRAIQAAVEARRVDDASGDARGDQAQIGREPSPNTVVEQT